MKLKVPFILLAALLLAACSTSAEQAPPTLTPQQQQGQTVFNLRCAQCHATVPDTIVIGPSLYGIATRAATRIEGYDAEAYIEHSILSPRSYIVEGFPEHHAHQLWKGTHQRRTFCNRFVLDDIQINRQLEEQ